MKRQLLVGLTLVVALGVFAATASAQHFTKSGQPVCTDIGTQLTCNAELAGLGNEDLSMTISADTALTTVCVSPGGNESPGQNRILGTTTTTSTIPGSAIKNGRARISATTTTPATPTARQAGCPNPNWTVRVADVEFSNIVVTITQADFSVTCTAAQPGALTC